MNLKRKKKLYTILVMMFGVGISVSLVLFALNKNINLYYTPSQLTDIKLPDRQIRLGGLVKKGSLRRVLNSLTLNFILTDFSHEVPIQYTGVLPALFREGQGVVVEGRFDQSHSFKATQLLAKHDENYRPPALKNKV